MYRACPQTGASDDFYSSDSADNRKSEMINYWNNFGPPYSTQDHIQFPYLSTGELMQLATKRFLGTCFTSALFINVLNPKLFAHDERLSIETMTNEILSALTEDEHDFLILSLWDDIDDRFTPKFSPRWIAVNQEKFDRQRDYRSRLYEERSLTPDNPHAKKCHAATSEYLVTTLETLGGKNWENNFVKCERVLACMETYFPIVIHISNEDKHYLKTNKHDLLRTWVREKILLCVEQRLNYLKANISCERTDDKFTFFGTLDSNLVFFILHHIETASEKRFCPCGREITRTLQKGPSPKYCSSVCRIKARGDLDYRKKIKDNMRHKIKRCDRFSNDWKQVFLDFSKTIDECYDKRWSKDDTLAYVNTIFDTKKRS